MSTFSGLPTMLLRMRVKWTLTPCEEIRIRLCSASNLEMLFTLFCFHKAFDDVFSNLRPGVTFVIGQQPSLFGPEHLTKVRKLFC